MDVGFAFGGFPSFPTLVAGRGKWIDVTQDPATGAVTVGNPRTFRTPWFTQSDVQLGHSYKLSDTKNIRFSATFTNLFNRRATPAWYTYINSDFATTYIAPSTAACLAVNLSLSTPLNDPHCYLSDGPLAYSSYEHPYDVKALLNNSPLIVNGGGPITINSWYGKPFLFQLSRNIRLGLRFTF